MHTIRRLLAVSTVIAVFFSCASAPESKKEKKNASATAPEWVSNPRTVYPEQRYVSATGFAPDRETAEKNALGALVAVFGQNVSGETTTINRYSEAVRGGSVSITEDTVLDQAVKTSFDLDTLVGAEIKDIWYDGKNTTYAVAVLERAKAQVTYSDLIDSNERTIQKLTSIPADEKNTLDAYARYDFAAALGDANGRFLNVLSVVSPGAAAAKRAQVTRGDDIRLECIRIAQTIPIAIRIAGDRDNRLASAFASAVSESGFRTGGDSLRYYIEGTITFAEAELAGNPNKFVRYSLDSRLVDSRTGAVLIPYSVNGREGHTSVSEAENRALRAAEAKVKKEYYERFAAFLVRLSSVN